MMRSSGASSTWLCRGVRMPTRSPSPRVPARFRAIVPSFRPDRPAGASARARTGALGLLGLVVLAACHRRETAPPPPAPRPALGAIDVEIAAPADDKTPRLQAASLERALRDHLLATGLF